jgi:hypothetical protein
MTLGFKGKRTKALGLAASRRNSTPPLFSREQLITDCDSNLMNWISTFDYLSKLGDDRTIKSKQRWSAPAGFIQPGALALTPAYLAALRYFFLRGQFPLQAKHKQYLAKHRVVGLFSRAGVRGGLVFTNLSWGPHASQNTENGPPFHYKSRAGS